jgi:hypothetical protein
MFYSAWGGGGTPRPEGLQKQRPERPVPQFATIVVTFQ